MPEFILSLGTPEAARRYAALDQFTQGYIEAMFFTSTGTGDDADNDLEHATFAELAPLTLRTMIEECKAFQIQNRIALDEALDKGRINGYDEKAAGRDFWYSRNGHGTGYWDRDLGDVGDTLHKSASQWRGRDLWRGDDGLIHMS
ncbi:hypothetical protein [Bradyrhizobium sp. S3.7.6]